MSMCMNKGPFFSWSGASADVISEQLVLSRELRQLLLQ